MNINMGLSPLAEYRFCKGENETSEFVFCSCFASTKIRRETLNLYFLKSRVMQTVQVSIPPRLYIFFENIRCATKFPLFVNRWLEK